MTKFFPMSLVVAGACLAGAFLAGSGGCTASTESKPADETKAPVEAVEGEAAATKTSGAQKRTPTGKVNLNATAARPTGDVERRAAAAPASASGPSHAVRQAQPTASAAGARTASTSGTIAKSAAGEAGASNDVEVRGARMSRAVRAANVDGRVDNAARMLQLEAGEGDSAG